MIHIGVSGPIAAGKSTLANGLLAYFLNKDMRTRIVPFAYSVKELAAIELDYTNTHLVQRVADRSTEIFTRLQLWGYDAITANKAASTITTAMEAFPTKPMEKNRRLLQTIGTEIGRDLIDKDIWVKRTKEVLSRNDLDFGLSDDLRFDNEALAVDIHIGISTAGREELYEARKNVFPPEYFFTNHASEQSLTLEPDIVVPIGFSQDVIDLIGYQILVMRNQQQVIDAANSPTKGTVRKTFEHIRDRLK